MEKIGIINCRETAKKCSGKGCKKAFKEKKDAFARYEFKEVKLVRFVHCRGCGENAVAGIIKEADKMEKRGVKTIHLSSCMKSICKWHDEFVFELSKKFEVVDSTHGSRDFSYCDTTNRKHSETAMDLFKKGYNCSQSVFLAFSDDCGLDFETAAKISSSFGAGMGRMREVCGAVTGMFMVAGVLYGYTDPEDQPEKIAHYQRIQTLANQFEEKNHSIICRELLGLEKGKDSPVPELRTTEYYQNRPCEALVGMAAEIMGKYIEEQK